MRPKSPLGVIRAGPPTLMPARRALQSAQNSHQHSSASLPKGASPRIGVPKTNCSGGAFVGVKRGRPDEGLGIGNQKVALTLLFPSSWQLE